MTRLGAACAAAAAVLAGCGGGTDPSNCIEPRHFEALVQAGVLTPRPPLRPGDLWVEPYVMRPIAAAPPAAVLYLPDGPHYVAGETPGYVCQL